MPIATAPSIEFEGEIKFGQDSINRALEFYFVIIPKQISDIFSRRGRVSAHIKVNDFSFDSVLEPDGNLSHWLKLDKDIIEKAKLSNCASAVFSINPLVKELEPIIPQDFAMALNANPIAQMGWDKTTTIARIDWVHWVETARQERTRAKRINDALNMLCEGKLRVCCFDQSGFYSKAIKAPIPN